MRGAASAGELRNRGASRPAYCESYRRRILARWCQQLISVAGSESKGLLSGLRWLDMNALQLEHADLGRRTAGCGKTANLAAGRQHPVAGDDQRHWIVGHGLADIARGLRPGTEFLRQSAVGSGAAPPDLPRRIINLLEERVLITEVELEARKIRFLALEIALHGGHRLVHFRRGCAGFGAGQPTQQHSLGCFRASCR